MTERKAFLLRLDPRVHDAVARWASDDLRSVNAQIEFLLRRALRAAGREGRPRGDAEGGGDGGTDPGTASAPGHDAAQQHPAGRR